MDKKWWKEAVFYQIYPRSFYDSNGDGIGDLKGITEKLPYLKELGVTAVWICPFFKSPMKDNGYDISDYYDVNPEFGTIEDADELIRCANENGIKIIMDMVINHTSDQHRWFQEARRDRHSKYRNYYIFKDNIDGLADLRSNFGGSTWTQIEDGSWYFHSFAKEQPDLNWECEEMRQELYDMMNWWLDKGVAGFRMDAITFIKKDLSFPPMPSDGEDGRCDVGKCCLNRPGIDEFLHELKLNTYGRGDFVTVAETPGVPSKDLDKYIGRDGHFSMIFDFSYTDIDINPGDLWLHQRDWTIEEFKDKLFTNQRLVKKIGWAANYLENHDQPRSIGKYFPAGDIPEYRTQMAKALGALFFFLKGTPFVYQGQELGMINTHFDNIDELDDINSKGQYARCLEAGYSETEAMKSVNIRSRDQSRLPMQWNSEKNFGFSAHEPWLACNNQCDLQTVELESVDKDSVLNFYKAMIQLRNHSEYTQTLIYGDLEDVETDNAGIIVYRRKPVQIECACGTGANAESADRSVYVVVNMTGKDVGYAIPETADVLMGNYADYDGTLRPYETVVYAV